MSLPSSQQVSEIKHQESFSEDSSQSEQVAELEAQKQELQEALEVFRQRARDMAVQKDAQIQRLKFLNAKLDAFVKTQLSPDQAAKLTAFTPEELAQLEEGEPEAAAPVNEQPRSQENMEYLKNVFVKYLEYLALNNQKEIHTIEHLLFTELRVSKDEAARLNLLREQNSFWKKYLSLPAQTTQQKVFSAGGLRKKLFGGMS